MVIGCKGLQLNGGITMKKFIALLSALFLCICLSTPAFATEVNTSVAVLNDSEKIVYQDEYITITQGNSSDVASTRAMAYESTWLNSSTAGSFPIYTANSGTIGVTFKVESSSDDSWASISLQKPDGSYYDGIFYVDRNSNNGDGIYFHIYFAKSGTYTVHYSAYTSVGMRIMCWMY